LAAGLILAALVLTALAASRPDPAFAVRIVKMSGHPADAGTKEHLRFCRELGFNALWVDDREAGAWTKAEAPAGPRLDPEFVRLAHWCRHHDVELWVAVHPEREGDAPFVYTDPERERRMLAFLTSLREKAGVHRIVLALEDAPTQLRELSDIFLYGASSAPAHLGLAGRLAGALPPDTALWLFAPAFCDAQLGDGSGPYARPFLDGLPSMPTRIGLVWTGPHVLSQKIGRDDLAATRARLRDRPLLLYDNFPTDDDGDEDDAMALVLGGLRGRDPALRDLVSGYVAVPSMPLAGSRLSLITSAAFLRDPGAYDAEAEIGSAIARLAGGDRSAAGALVTQQLEWGGAVGGRNYWPRSLLNPAVAAGRLQDPAFVDSFTWTVARYPERIAALSKLKDAPFREALLKMMRRRLAIARAVPLAVDYLAKTRSGDPGAAAVLTRIGDERRSTANDADAKRVLELFLTAAGIPATPVAR
jgi:hypothetical protein